MSESGDYEPAPWNQGHNFDSQRLAYDQHAGRSYAQAKQAQLKAGDLVPEAITTGSGHPFLIRCDVTGSMSGWPNTIFSKLPYLDHEARTEYLGEDMEISFGAISDTGDEYPLQVRPFTKEGGLEAELLKLVITDGGTGPGDRCEAYGLSALYDLNNVHMPGSLIVPPLIIIGDEKPYEHITAQEAKELAKVDVGKASSSRALFEQLMEKYEVYLIQKPYGSETISGDRLTGATREVNEAWKGILGEERIAFLQQPERVVDVIFGILAHYADKVDYFRKEIVGRQKPGQVKTVYQSLETIHSFPARKTLKKLAPGGSILHGTRTKGGRGGKNADPLI